MSGLASGLVGQFAGVLSALYIVAAAVLGVFVLLAGVYWIQQLVGGDRYQGYVGYGSLGDGMSYQVDADGRQIIYDRNGDEYAAVSADGDTVVYASDLGDWEREYELGIVENVEYYRDPDGHVVGDWTDS